jgi:hypothetical protein
MPALLLTRVFYTDARQLSKEIGPQMDPATAYGPCPRRTKPPGLRRFRLIGATGFEPATFRPPAECATRLRHAPGEGPSLGQIEPSVPRRTRHAKGGGHADGPEGSASLGPRRGRGVTAAQEPSKLLVRVRFPSPAPSESPATAAVLGCLGARTARAG